MAEAGAAEVFFGRLVDPLVLAEDEAPRQLGLARGHAPRQPVPRAPADRAAVRQCQGDDEPDPE